MNLHHASAPRPYDHRLPEDRGLHQDVPLVQTLVYFGRLRSVALRLLDGFSYKEIGGITGLTESNGGMKINRIKSALAGKRMEETES
jgi:hypothetical protein